MKKFIDWYSNIELYIRSHLSRYNILYGIIGGVAIILFWRGVWIIADELQLSGWASFLGGLAVLLFTGLLTSSFIGDQIIISGLRREKKVVDLEENQLKTERDIIKEVKREVERVEGEVLTLEKEVEHLEKEKTPS